MSKSLSALTLKFGSSENGYASNSSKIAWCPGGKRDGPDGPETLKLELELEPAELAPIAFGYIRSTSRWVVGANVGAALDHSTRLIQLLTDGRTRRSDKRTPGSMRHKSRPVTASRGVVKEVDRRRVQVEGGLSIKASTEAGDVVFVNSVPGSWPLPVGWQLRSLRTGAVFRMLCDGRSRSDCSLDALRGTRGARCGEDHRR